MNIYINNKWVVEGKEICFFGADIINAANQDLQTSPRTLSTEVYVAASNAPYLFQCTASLHLWCSNSNHGTAEERLAHGRGEGGCWVFRDTVILQANQEERAAKEKEERQFGE
jgi:hypothetical protein